MIAPTSAEDAKHIAENLRDKDRQSIAAWSEEDPSELAYYWATHSPLSWVVYSPRAKPICMFGADGEKGETFGAAWMYSTDDVRQAPLAIVKGVSCAIAISRSWWPELRISAEPRDEKQLKFLQFVGFRERSRFERDGQTFVELLHA